MILLFVPSFDPETAANYNFALELLTSDTTNFHPLLDINATKENLYHTITNKNKCSNIFIMSHGSNHGVLDQNKKITFDVNDCNLISEKTVFCWACNTGKKLFASRYSAKKNIWFGYNTSLTAPSYDAYIKDNYLQLFSFIAKNFQSVKDEIDAYQFLDGLKTIAEEQLKAISNLDNDLIISSASCFTQSWKNLVIWLPAHSEGIKHLEAQEELLDFP